MLCAVIRPAHKHCFQAWIPTAAQGHTGSGFTVHLTHHAGKTCSSPHFVLGFLKTVGHIVNLLKRGDHALLVAGHRGVKRKDVGAAGQSVLGGQTDTCTDVLDKVQTYWNLLGQVTSLATVGVRLDQLEGCSVLLLPKTKHWERVVSAVK